MTNFYDELDAGVRKPLFVRIGEDNKEFLDERLKILNKRPRKNKVSLSKLVDHLLTRVRELEKRDRKTTKLQRSN